MLNDLCRRRRRKTAMSSALIFLLGWTITTAERERKPHMYEIKNIDEAVFLVGPDQREKSTRVRGSELTLNITDDWHFTDDAAASVATSIFGDYERVFGPSPSGRLVVGIRKFPNPIAVDNWEAGTRGRTVTIVSSDMPSNRSPCNGCTSSCGTRCFIFGYRTA